MLSMQLIFNNYTSSLQMSDEPKINILKGKFSISSFPILWVFLLVCLFLEYHLHSFISIIYKIGKYKEKRTKDVDTSRMGVN